MEKIYILYGLKYILHIYFFHFFIPCGNTSKFIQKSKLNQTPVFYLIIVHLQFYPSFTHKIMVKKYSPCILISIFMEQLPSLEGTPLFMIFPITIYIWYIFRYIDKNRVTKIPTGLELFYTHTPKIEG